MDGWIRRPSGRCRAPVPLCVVARVPGEWSCVDRGVAGRPGLQVKERSRAECASRPRSMSPWAAVAARVTRVYSQQVTTDELHGFTPL